MKSLFHHITDPNSTHLNDYESQSFQKAISIHPFKNSDLKYKIHNGFNYIKIKKLRAQYLNLQIESDEIKSIFIDRKIKFKNIFLKPRQTILNYALFDRKGYFYKAGHRFPKTRLAKSFRKILNHTLEKLIYDTNKKSIETNLEIHYIKILTGYTRYNPFIGLQTLLYNLISYQKLSSKPRKFIKNEIFRIKQVFLNTLFKNENSLKDLNEKEIIFILTLSDRLQAFRKFIQNFENICLKTEQNVKLIIVLYEKESNSELVFEQVEKLKKKYDKNRITLIIKKSVSFSKSECLQTGAENSPENGLLFFIDVDILFNKESLHRIRMNTIENRQVYFPIVFNQFSDNIKVNNPKKIEIFEISQENGMWRDVGFGMVGVYKSDWRKVGGFDVSLVGWGKEDVDFYDRFIRKANLSIFRSVDPGLVHVYHEKVCDKNIAQDQYVMCLSSKASMFASNKALSELFYYQNFTK